MNQPDNREIDGRLYPRVSKILEYVPDPPPLARWKLTASPEDLARGAAKGEAKARLGTIAHALVTGEDVENSEFDEYHQAHERWQAMVVKKEAPKDPYGYVSAQVDWLNEVGGVIEETEKQVYSKLFGYCGTLDVKIRIDGFLYIVDYKTGRKNSKQMLQGSAYRVADYEMTSEETAGVIMLYLKPNGKFTEDRKSNTDVNFFWFMQAKAKHDREKGTSK